MSLKAELSSKGRSSLVVLTLILIVLLENRCVHTFHQKHSVSGMRERENVWKLDWECIPEGGCQNDAASSNLQLNVTVLLPFDPYYKASLSRVGQAIYLGFEKVRDMGLLPNYNFSLHYKNSACSNVYAPYKFMEDVFHHRVDVFFGPSCELALGRWYFSIFILLRFLGISMHVCMYVFLRLLCTNFFVHWVSLKIGTYSNSLCSPRIIITITIGPPTFMDR